MQSRPRGNRHSLSNRAAGIGKYVWVRPSAAAGKSAVSSSFPRQTTIEFSGNKAATVFAMTCGSILTAAVRRTGPSCFSSGAGLTFRAWARAAITSSASSNGIVSDKTAPGRASSLVGRSPLPEGSIVSGNRTGERTDVACQRRIERQVPYRVIADQC